MRSLLLVGSSQGESGWEDTRSTVDFLMERSFSVLLTWRGLPEAEAIEATAIDKFGDRKSSGNCLLVVLEDGEVIWAVYDPGIMDMYDALLELHRDASENELPAVLGSTPLTVVADGVEADVDAALSAMGIPGSQSSDRLTTVGTPNEDAPPCSTCGTIIVRSGACYKCSNCGTTWTPPSSWPPVGNE